MPNLLNDNLLGLVKANQQLLNELIASKTISLPEKINLLSILVKNAQVLNDLDHS